MSRSQGSCTVASLAGVLLLSACASGGSTGALPGAGGGGQLPVTLLPPASSGLYLNVGAPAAGTRGNGPQSAEALGAASFLAWDWANDRPGPKPAAGTTFSLLQSVLKLDPAQGTISADNATMAAGATVTVVGTPNVSEVRLQVPTLGIDVITNVHTSQVFSGSYSDYTFYGAWTQPGGTHATGAYVYGYVTPANAVPTQGRALHHGEVRGNVYGPSGKTSVVGWGDVTIDFSSHAVSGKLRDMREGVLWTEIPPFTNPFNDIAVNGTQAGGVVTGTTSVTSTPVSTISMSAGATGHFNGELFGPAGNELGAVWTLSDGTRSATGIFLGYGTPAP